MKPGAAEPTTAQEAMASLAAAPPPKPSPAAAATRKKSDVKNRVHTCKIAIISAM